MKIHASDLKTDAVRRLTSVKDRDLSDYLWLTDDRLLYIKDRGDDESTYLYTVD